MIPSKHGLVFLVLLLALLVGCGSPGEPLPPSLELARPVSDLRASRKGSLVTLTWTAPSTTTDRHNIRHPGPTVICRSSGATQQCGIPVAKLPPTKAGDKDLSRSYVYKVSDFSASPDAKVVLAVEVLNSYGRSGGLSNQVEIPAATTLRAPELKAQLNGDGVHLSWAAPAEVPAVGLRFMYRVYRRETKADKPVLAGEVPLQSDAAPAFLDSGIEWEKTYQYHLTVVTLIPQPQGPEQQVEGDDSPEIAVVAHDIFPPATPSGLQAVSSGPGQKPFIDLVWAPDTDADLAGYNIYRSEAGAEPGRLNAGPIKSPAFRDEAVVPGHEYAYSVSAIDVRGNESPRSEPASEKVPEQ